MILITGATGLVGSHLLFNLLVKGKKVRAIKRSSSDITLTKKIFSYYSTSPDQLFNQIEWVDGDIIDVTSLQEAMNGINEVYHCAALVSFLPKDKDALIKINIEGTYNVVNAALYHQVKKLCYVSSVAALGRSKINQPINETTEWEDSTLNSTYALSKYSAEREVHRAIAEGLDVVIVNPSIIIGPGDWNKSSSNLFRMVWNGLKFYSLGINAYIDVRDVAQVMTELMDSEIRNERFILCTDHLSYQDFFTLVAKHLQKPQPYIHATPFLGELAWRIEKVKSFLTGKNPYITKETAITANKKIFYSNEKIKKHFNHSFIPISQSIKETAQHFINDHAK